MNEADQILFPIRLRAGNGEITGYMFYCPGCRECHHMPVRPWTRVSADKLKGEENGPVWTFNGSMDQPTFSPSLLYNGSHPVCHSFVTGGNLVFLADCQHDLRGKTVPMIPHKNWFK